MLNGTSALLARRAIAAGVAVWAGLAAYQRFAGCVMEVIFESGTAGIAAPLEFAVGVFLGLVGLGALAAVPLRRFCGVDRGAMIALALEGTALFAAAVLEGQGALWSSCLLGATAFGWGLALVLVVSTSGPAGGPGIAIGFAIEAGIRVFLNRDSSGIGGHAAVAAVALLAGLLGLWRVSWTHGALAPWPRALRWWVVVPAALVLSPLSGLPRITKLLHLDDTRAGLLVLAIHGFAIILAVRREAASGVLWRRNGILAATVFLVAGLVLSWKIDESVGVAATLVALAVLPASLGSVFERDESASSAWSVVVGLLTSIGFFALAFFGPFHDHPASEGFLGATVVGIAVTGGMASHLAPRRAASPRWVPAALLIALAIAAPSVLRWGL